MHKVILKDVTQGRFKDVYSRNSKGINRGLNSRAIVK